MPTYLTEKMARGKFFRSGTAKFLGPARDKVNGLKGRETASVGLGRDDLESLWAEYSNPLGGSAHRAGVEY